MVRVPTLATNNVSKFLESKDQQLKKNSVAGVKSGISSVTDSTHFYPQHPPEVFFIQQSGTDKLNSFLLNFVPSNPNKDFGENGLWTGQLFE